MSEIERRLRAAMKAGAELWSAEQRSVDEQSGQPLSAGLLTAVRRRHRRHVRRASAASVAGVLMIAIAVPSIAHVLGDRQGPDRLAPQTQPASGGPSPARSTSPAAAAAAAKTVLRDCGSANYSNLGGSDWRAQSLRVGPLWFYGALHSGNWTVSRQLGHGEVQAVGVPVVIQSGATVIVRVAAGARSRFRFLAGFDANNRYRLTAGEPGATFVGCPAAGGALTVFWVGYLNDGLTCVPFDVQTSPTSQPIRIAISATGGSCTA